MLSESQESSKLTSQVFEVLWREDKLGLEDGVLNSRSHPDNFWVECLTHCLDLAQLVLKHVNLADEISVLWVVLKVGLDVHDLLDLWNVLIELRSDSIDLFLALFGNLLGVSLVLCLLLGLLNTSS